MPNDSEKIAQTVHNLIKDTFIPQEPRIDAKSDLEWQKMHATGTQLWLDTGDIDEAGNLWAAEFSALTTNNTLLNKEVQKGIYDELVGKVAASIRKAVQGIDDKTLLLEVAFVLNAWHGLRLVERFGANVSVELHTDLAHDIDRTVAYGKRYHAICPEKFIIKVPLTPAGFLGARKLAQAGITINFTLGFSARQNYLAALLTQPGYVNVFMGRLNAFVIDSKLGDGENVGEKATLATQQALIALRKAGRTNSHLIGASMRAGKQLGSLAGLDVFTMPPKVAAEYRKNPLANVVSQVTNDPAVSFAPGVSLKDFNGGTLWEIPENFKASVDALLANNPDSLCANALQDHFEKDGLGDFLPRWTDAEIKDITADGKIPSYARWKNRLANGNLGLDALMNISGLCSFIQDQTALDNRIKSFL
ncbi:MAG TPA: transaldolase family protein [Candidatus Hydrogenedentes bacterium]|nr:transaldolase family protein [Candidatus Hydrogenedentota bacterium]